LDSTAYLTGQNKILLADKKTNWKLKRAGSDDKPKNFDNKRTNNLKGSTSGNTLNNLKSDSLTRDKNRKFSSKPSNDKYLKSKDTSNALINMSSNLSSK